MRHKKTQAKAISRDKKAQTNSPIQSLSSMLGVWSRVLCGVRRRRSSEAAIHD